MNPLMSRMVGRQPLKAEPLYLNQHWSVEVINNPSDLDPYTHIVAFLKGGLCYFPLKLICNVEQIPAPFPTHGFAEKLLTHLNLALENQTESVPFYGESQFEMPAITRMEFASFEHLPDGAWEYADAAMDIDGKDIVRHMRAQPLPKGGEPLHRDPVQLQELGRRVREETRAAMERRVQHTHHTFDSSIPVSLIPVSMYFSSDGKYVVSRVSTRPTREEIESDNEWIYGSLLLKCGETDLRILYIKVALADVLASHTEDDMLEAAVLLMRRLLPDDDVVRARFYLTRHIGSGAPAPGQAPLFEDVEFPPKLTK